MADEEAIVQKVFAATSTGERLHLRWTSDGRPICPVCGCVWPMATGHAWEENGEVTNDGLRIVSPSWDTCPCCSTEFGNDDVAAAGESVEGNWGELRNQWLDRVGRNAEAMRQVRDYLGLEP